MQTFLFIILMTITLIGLFGLAIQVFKTSLLTIYVNAELTILGLTTVFCVAGALFKESNGYLMTLIIITVTAVEAAIGLGLLVLYYRFFRSTKIKQMARYLRCLLLFAVPNAKPQLTPDCLEILVKMGSIKVLPGLDSDCAHYARAVQRGVLQDNENIIAEVLLVWKGQKRSSDYKQAILDLKSKGGVFDHDLWNLVGISSRDDLMAVIKYLLENEPWTPWDERFVTRLREFYELLKWEQDMTTIHITNKLAEYNESSLNTGNSSGKGNDVPSIVEENMQVLPLYTKFKAYLYEAGLLELQVFWNRLADSLSTGSIQSVSGYFRFGYEWVLKTAIPLSLLQLISVLITVAFYTMAERKVMGAIQRRKGPNVNGPQGVAQPIEDGLKLLSKETIVPTNADKLLFFIAPAISFVLAFSAWAFVPFQEISGFSDFHTTLLFLFALSSLGVYGVIVGGWASNSKYAFLGALRSTAQMISYEIILGLIFLTLAFLCGSLSLYDILSAQKIIWFCVPLWPFLFLFVIAMLAETNRAPFDLPEAEAEIVAGYNIEYAGIVFALFFLAEYSNMLIFSALFIILFFGGAAPYVGLTGIFFFVLKLLIVAVLFIVIRAALPRLRYDQLMVKSWTILMPLAFIIFLFVVVVVTMCVFPFFTVKTSFLAILESNSNAVVTTTQQVDLLLQLDKYSSTVFQIIDAIRVFWDTFFIPCEGPEIDPLFFFYVLENLTKTEVILFFVEIVQNDIFGHFFQTSAETLLFLLFFRSSLIRLASKKPVVLFPLQKPIKWYFYNKNNKLQLLDNWQIRSQLTDFLILLNPAHSCVLWGLFVILVPGKKKKYKSKKDPLQILWKKHEILDPIKNKHISFNRLNSPEEVARLENSDTTNVIKDFYLNQHRAEQIKRIQKTAARLKISETYEPKHKDGVGSWFSYIRKHYFTIWRPFLRAFGTKQERRQFNKEKQLLKKTMRRRDSINEKANLVLKQPEQYTELEIQQFSQLNNKLINEMSPETLERAKEMLKTKQERRREAQKLNLQKIKLEYEKRKARREWVYSYFKQKNEDDIKTNSSTSMKNLTAQRMAWYKEIDQTKPYIYKRRITPLLSNNVRDTIHPDLETVKSWKAFYKVYWPNADIDGATTNTQHSTNPWPVNSDDGPGKDMRSRNTPVHHMIALNRAGFSKGNSLYQIFNQYFGILDNSWNLVIQPRINIDAEQYRVFDLFTQRVESVVENFRFAYDFREVTARNERMQQMVNDYQWILRMAYDRRYKTPGTDKELELFFEYLNALSVNKLIYGVSESRAQYKQYLEFLEEYEALYGWTIDKPPSLGWRRRGISDKEYADSKVFWQILRDFRGFHERFNVRIPHYVLNHIRIRDSWDRVCKGHRDVNLGALHIMFTMKWDLIPARYEQACVMAQHKRTMTPYTRRVFNTSIPVERVHMMNSMPNFFYKFREESIANLRAHLLVSQFRTLHRLLQDSPEYFPPHFPEMLHDDSRIRVPVFEVSYISEGNLSSFDQFAKTFALNPIMDDNSDLTIEEEDRVLGCVNHTMPDRMARHRFSSLWLVTEKHDPFHESMWFTMGQNFMYILVTPFWKMLEEFRAESEEYVGAKSIEYYEAGYELTDDVFAEVCDEASQLCSEEMDRRLPLTGMYGPRGLADFKATSRYELATTPYVHCTEALGSDLIGLPSSQICAQNNFLQTTAFMQRFIDVDIPWLFVMESQLSPALPLLAIPTAVAVAYLTNRQALATKTNYSPLPPDIKIETLNSPNILTTKHDTLHTFFGWVLKPKIIEHPTPQTANNIFYDWNGQGWWIPKYEVLTPPPAADSPNGLIIGLILLIGIIGVSYAWFQQEPTYVQTHKDLLKNMRSHRYDTKKYIYYLKHKRNHEFYNAIPENGPWYTEYSIKLWYTRFLDGLAWCSKTIDHVFTNISTTVGAASTNAEMLLMSWYSLIFIFFYKLYSILFIKRFPHELRLTENWEIRALLTRKTKPFIANTIRALIGIFIQSLVFLPKILWVAVSTVTKKIFFFIDYSTKGIYLFVLTIFATLSWYYFLEFMNNPINNSTFEHTTWYYEINSDGTWQNWTRTPQHLDFYNEALKKDALNAKYQLWFSYLWEPMYGRYGEGQNNMLYADGQIRSGRRKSHQGKRYFDRWADFRWYIHDYDATQKYYPWETKKWRKKWHMLEKIENFNKLKLKKPTKNNKWFYNYYAQNTEYDQWNNMWFTYNRRSYGRALVEDPASIISHLVLDNYLMDAGALTLIIFVPIVVIYNYIEYIQAFGSKPEGLDVYDRTWPKKPTPAPATKFELTTISTYLPEGFEIINTMRNHLYSTKMDELLKNTTIYFVDDITINIILKKSQTAWDHANYEILKIIETPIITQNDQRKFPKELETEITNFIWNGQRDSLWTQIIKERDIYYKKTTQIREIEWAKIKKEIQNDDAANHYQGWLKNYIILLAWLEYHITFSMPYYYSATERFAYLFPDKENDQEKW